jgi:hypothetical protein
MTFLMKTSNQSDNRKEQQKETKFGRERLSFAIRKDNTNSRKTKRMKGSKFESNIGKDMTK